MLRAALPAAVRPPFPSGPCVPPGAPILRECVAFPGGGAPTRRGLGAQPQAYFGSFCTHKRNAPAASRTGFAPCKINAPPLGDHNLGLIFLLPTFHHRKVGPRRVGALTKPCTRLRPAEGEMKLWHNLCHQSLRHGCAVPPPFTQGRLSPLGTHKFSPEILLPPFHHGKAAPPTSPFVHCISRRAMVK